MNHPWYANVRLAIATIYSSATRTLPCSNARKNMPAASIALAVLLGSTFPLAHADPEPGPAWSIVDLGTLGGSGSRANGINNRGQVVGQIERPGPTSNTAFLYEDGVMTELNIPGSFISARGVNDAGEVVAYSSAGETQPYLYRDGVVEALNIQGYSFAINNAGTVAGVLGQAERGVAFVYQKGVVKSLGTLGGVSSFAFGINNAGTTVGYSSTADGNSHAFVYRDGAMTDLGTLGGWFSNALGINDRGMIVGASNIAGNAEEHAYIYDENGMHDIGTLGGGFSIARGINNAGVVVGVSAAASGGDHAFLYRCGAMTDLATIPEVKQAGWLLSDASAINDRGQIVGVGFIHGQYHAFLLSPSSAAGGCAGAH